MRVQTVNGYIYENYVNANHFAESIGVPLDTVRYWIRSNKKMCVNESEVEIFHSSRSYQMRSVE